MYEEKIKHFGEHVLDLGQTIKCTTDTIALPDKRGHLMISLMPPSERV